MEALRPRHPEKLDRPDSPILRKPAWIRVKAPISQEYEQTRALMRRLKLNTVFTIPWGSPSAIALPLPI